jgi:tetraacyldisaccharide 4'-kinase
VQSGHTPLLTIAFSDHHRFGSADLARLRREAAALDATLVTTAKDAVRLPPGMARVLRVSLEWDDPAAIELLLHEAMGR